MLCACTASLWARHGFDCCQVLVLPGQLDDVVAGHSWTAIANLSFEQSDWQASLQASTRAVEYFQAARLPRLTAWAQYFCLMAAWGAG